MRLTDLTVRDFRNIASIDTALPEPGVVIVGGNAQGKTNFLEAIYYLVLFRSFRGAKDRELVRFGTDGFFVGGTTASRVTAGYEVAGKRKKITVDRNPVPRVSAAVGRVVAVPFSPADRSLVTGGPGERRRYLNVLLSLSTPGYLQRLSAMRAALKQRNAALRSGQADAARAFDAVFADAADDVTRVRRAWVANWRDRLSAISAALGESPSTGMQYLGYGSPPRGEAGDLRRALAECIDRDLRRGATSVGPHRDDLRLSLGDHKLRTYGSAGQQRTAAVALRLLEAETLADATGQPPIGLYDDVFAELDATRQARLLELIRDRLAGQAIIAAPRDTEVPRELLDRPRWTIRGGALEQ